MNVTLASSRKRVALTFGANIYNQLVTVGVQILLVPVLLHFWGTEQYGVWLLLSALPTYLTLADLGFTMSARNEMTIKTAHGDKPGALVTYQSIFMLLNSVVAIVFICAVAAFAAADLSQIFSLGQTSEWTAKAILLLLAVNVLLFQYLGLLCGGLRCAGRPAEEMLWVASARLGEGLITGGAAAFGGGILAAAFAIVACRLAFICTVWWRLRHLAPWLQLGYAHASRVEIHKLFHPSLSFMFWTIGHALMIQGPVVILGLIGTPLQIVIFSTSRTLVRLGTSAANMLNYALMPEYSRLFGAGSLTQYMRLVRFQVSATLAMTLIYLGALSFGGDWILRLWTQGQVGAEQPFFTILLLAMDAEMIWSALFIPLAAINRHIRISYAFVVFGILGLAWAYAAGPLLASVTAPLLAVHVLMIPIAGFQLWRLGGALHDSARLEMEMR
jgi:O-antigen/teichoic acid export membrane protein